jgi:hypothetical protein
MTYDQEIFWCISQTMYSRTTIWKLPPISGIMSLHMNIFRPKLILFICSSQMPIIISFLSNGDSKYSYAFHLKTDVVLRVSHKECYWAYSDCKDFSLMGHNSIILGT